MTELYLKGKEFVYNHHLAVPHRPLVPDGSNWQMPTSVSPQDTTQGTELRDAALQPMQRSLFDPVFASELNSDEREVAVYLDGQEALGWWHRNGAKRHYGLQGWRRGNIYPDFIFSLMENGKTSKLVALEMKGDHLAGNHDTEYKRRVLQFLTENFALDDTYPVDEMVLENKGKNVVCDLVLMNDWQEKLPQFLQ